MRQRWRVPILPSVVRHLAGVLLLALGVQGCSSGGPPLANGSAGPVPRPAPASAAPRIELPEGLALEAPTADGIPADAPAAKAFFESATSGSLTITHDQTGLLRPGAHRVTWTAWEGVVGQSAIGASRTEYLYVFPLGQSPAGTSRRHDATAGNHSAKIARDASGRVHAVWHDPGPGGGVMYRRGVPDLDSGGLRWETPPTRLSDEGSGHGLPGLAAGPGAIHVAWAGRSGTRYRRLVRVAEGWRLEPIRNTGATGEAWDNGPDIASRGDDEIHVLTYSGQYAVSTDAGARWRVERVPRPAGAGMKNPALAVDSQGQGHVVFTALIRSVREGTGSRPQGSYWELRYVRRQPQGGWADAQNVLGAFPAWQDQGARDVLADWPDIAVDRDDALHVAWHGTAGSGMFGRDEAFYSRRPAAGPGAWGPWEAPQALHPRSPATGNSFSFAPSLAVDPRSDAVLAVVFFETEGLPREVFDSDLVVLRGGRIVGDPIPLAHMARNALAAERAADALSTWFPCAAPSVFRDAAGRAWLDVLQTEQTPERHRSRHLVVYQRLDVTRLVGPRPAASPSPTR